MNMEIIANGELKTGYPHIDRPWMNFYSLDEKTKTNTNRSIFDYLIEKTAAHKKSTAISYFGKKISYGKLIQKIEQAAKILKFVGVKPKDRIMYMMPNIPETAYFTYGASRIGAVSDFIDPRPDSVNLVISAKKILDLAKTEKVEYIIALDQCYLGMIKSIERELVEAGVKKVIVVSASDSMGLKEKINYLKESLEFSNIKTVKSQLQKTKQLTKLLKQALKTSQLGAMQYKELIELSKDEELEEIEFTPNETCVIVHTSGTSSPKPKPIPLTNENLNEYVEQTEIGNMPMEPDDKALHILPYFAAFGLVGVVHGGLCHNNNLIQIPEFEPANLGKLILKHKPETIIGPPTWFLNLIKDPVLKEAELSFIKMITYGGDSMEPEDEVRINEFLKRHKCQAQLTKGHGMSETCGCASYATGEYNVLGSMGIPMPNTIYAIVNPETKEPIKFNETDEFIEGELAIYSPTTTPGVIDGVEITNKTIIDGKEYLLTKDIARMNRNGVMFFLTRSDRAFMRFDGFKVKPYEIENLIKNDTRIKYCIVTPYHSDEKNGQMIKATIVMEDNIELTTEEQKEFVEEIIEKYFINNESVSARQIPTKFSFKNSLPLTANSKVDYKQVAKEGLNGEEITVEIEETNISVGSIKVTTPDKRTLKR